MIIVYSAALPLNNGNPMKEMFDRNDLFEGDLKISSQTILENYDFKSLPGGEEIMQKYLRLITGDKNEKIYQSAKIGSNVTLWNREGVPYRISPKFSAEERTSILQAIRHWEENTCLVFTEVQPGKSIDYIDFINSDSGCYSDSIGNEGGRQIINLAPRCEEFSTVVHEIGHAIGFWHEQSRPDRDEYVTIKVNNIRSEFLHNFFKRKSIKVDHQGSKYDFGSIMHYTFYDYIKPNCIYTTPFSCNTIEIKNYEEFVRQGKPSTGYVKALSHRDIEQANRLYSCPGKGLKGDLTIYVEQGSFGIDSHLKDGHSGIYVRIIVVDSNGIQHVRRTSYWNQWIAFGEREWQFFRISTWHANDTGSEFQVTMQQTILLKSGKYFYLKNCNNENCSIYITFNYAVSKCYTEAHSFCYEVMILIYTIFFYYFVISHT